MATLVMSMINMLYRTTMILSVRMRKLKLKFDIMHQEKEKKFDFLLDFICGKHSDFLLFENFRHNCSQTVVMMTLTKCFEHYQREKQVEIEERSKLISELAKN